VRKRLSSSELAIPIEIPSREHGLGSRKAFRALDDVELNLR
jgi:hypothetical protein